MNDIMEDLKTAQTELESEDELQEEKATEEVTPEGPVNEEPVSEEPEVVQPVEAPSYVPSELRGEWGNIPESFRTWVQKREEDQHKMFTSQDGELRMGREFKEMVAPYMAIIQAQGSTPKDVVGSILNTAYRLRTGSEQEKLQIFQELAQQYGVPLDGLQNQEYLDPTIAALQKEIGELKNQYNPSNMQKQLQEYSEQARLQAEVNAFAADPAHKHYEQVKGHMAALLGSGAAKDLQEAYEKALWADPTIRSTLLAEQKAEEEAKRTKAIEAKKAASSSLSGSPAPQGNAKTPKDTVHEELSANWDALLSSRL